MLTEFEQTKLSDGLKIIAERAVYRASLECRIQGGNVRYYGALDECEVHGKTADEVVYALCQWHMTREVEPLIET